MNPHVITRRDLLGTAAQSIGIAGLATVLGGQASAAPNLLAAKTPHFAPRAKRIIHLWMNGGPSQVDTFDPKPALQKFAGQKFGDLIKDKSVEGLEGGSNNLLIASPFRFAKHGQSGMEISEIFPHIARHADDLCVIRSMHTDVPRHEASTWMMFTGHLQPVRPAYGSWLLYGLGSVNENLPGFVVLGEGLPINGASNWGSRFLPGIYQGCNVLLPQKPNYDSREVLANLASPSPADVQRQRLDFAQQLNSIHLRQRGVDNAFTTRIESLELAFRMQAEASEAFDLSRETAATHAAYGTSATESKEDKVGVPDNSLNPGIFARNCLLARRLLERGVRVVQVYAGPNQPWDTHGFNARRHKVLAKYVDQPIAALLQDLKQRGLLDDTLVVWGGEFGRTPTSGRPEGRDHNSSGFTVWLAGGGVRGGMVFGATEEFGYKAVENRVHVHDLHATMLHLMGVDHERLTYRFSGRDYRLTDVHGRIVKEIIA